MNKSVFGWNYPPGCSGPPDDDYPCMVCGQYEGFCECPECPVCGEYGNPECYKEHGLQLTFLQIHQRNQEQLNALWEAYQDERWWLSTKAPPCIECGAMTQEEAETKCHCGGDHDYCHGCELWPD